MHIFILFLVCVLLVFAYLSVQQKQKVMLVWLLLASLAFYAYFNPIHLPVLVISVLVNFGLGYLLEQKRIRNDSGSEILLALGITLNLIVLAYFKYTDFLLSVFWPSHTGAKVAAVSIPLGISFITFQHISFLNNVRRGVVRKPSLLSYALMISFFPHVISGPLVRYEQIAHQFEDCKVCRFDWTNIASGGTLFTLGAFKKFFISDYIAMYSDRLFAVASNGVPVSFIESWAGVILYTMQIYFDFSGYSDMALGIAHTMGITLQNNFDSPYKAKNIIDFWRRWHISLSHFLRDYLYIPLGGNRKGSFRKYLNLMITLVLAGIWHGAGWTFIVWGFLHGTYLIINHGWNSLNLPSFRYKRVTKEMSIIMTFLCVSVAWIFFRADTLDAALQIVRGIFGLNGFILPDTYLAPLGRLGQMLKSFGWIFDSSKIYAFGGNREVLLTLFLYFVVRFFPNTQTIVNFPETELKVGLWRWRPHFVWAILLALLLTCVLLTPLEKPFVYFEF